MIACALLLTLGLHAQQHEVQYGVHVRGGSSSSASVSSNIGDTCYATGYYSFAGGHKSYAQGACSFAYGNMSYATQSNAYAMGNMANASGANSLSLGFYTQANQNGSIVIGSGANNNAPLVSNVSGIMLGTGSCLPTLFISRASGSHNTGKIGVGNVTSPQAKLHVASDEFEDAAVFLQPTGKNKGCSLIKMTDDNHKIIVNNNGSMDVTASNNELGLHGSNVNLTGNGISIGYSGNRRFFATTQGNPAIYSNAYRTVEACYRYTEGSSYAIEFNNNEMLFRTAVNQLPRGVEITNWRDALSVKTDGAITLNGRVGVNTENTTGDYALAVDGGIITTKVHIQDVNDWQDRVFDGDYPLMTLDDVEEYVAEHRHLPGIPSEAEVKAGGFDLTAMTSALLGKVEELTLYTIRQQREIDSLRDLVTVRFGYDACGNRTRRTLEFSMVEEERGASPGGTPHDAGAQWQASLSDSFAGVEAMLFPNPTEGGFFLALTGEEIPNDATATLCSVDGKAIEERKVGGMTEEFDLRGKPAGVYLLRLSSSDSVKTWKIVKR